MATFKPGRKALGFRSLRLPVILLIGMLVAAAIHVRYGHHRVVVVNERGVPVRSLALGVVGEQRALGNLPVGGIVTRSFRNPWPKDAALVVRIESMDGSAEEHQCLYLGILPQVALVRLVAEGVDCKNVGPAILVP